MQEKNLAQLIAGLPESERVIAAENLDRYLELAWEVLQELQDKK